MDKTKAFLITILVVLLFGIPITIDSSQNRILVIYSTSADSIRTQEINRGIELYRNNHPEFADSIIIEYYYRDMDMEKTALQKCETYLTEIQNTKKIIEGKKPDLVILSGDMAQRLIGIRLVTPQSSNENYLKKNAEWLAEKGGCAEKRETKEKLLWQITPITLNNQPKIVFTGVTINDVKDYGYYENANLAGIYEHLYIPAVKEALEDLYVALPDEPDSKPANIIVVGDLASTANQSIQQMKAELSKKDAFEVPLKWGGIMAARSSEKWQQLIRDANNKNSLVFVAGYSDLISEKQDLIRWTQACARFPVLGGTESFIEDGGMLSVTISNLEQGEMALELAWQLLEKNRPVGNIAFIEPIQFSIGLNKSLLDSDKWHISLPVMYESFSRASDKYQDEPYNYYPTDCQ